MDPVERNSARALFLKICQIAPQAFNPKEVKRQRDNSRAASMSDERRNELNKMRRESYNRKKGQEFNNENDRGKEIEEEEEAVVHGSTQAGEVAISKEGGGGRGAPSPRHRPGVRETWSRWSLRMADGCHSN
ncbi:hypothetical protein SEVIR_9G061650v4 [Setaria viridis]